jgi:predicted XRE-type DNA-binding protein
MAGNRLKVARDARAAVQQRIATWVRAQPGTQQKLCRRLDISASQLTVLISEGVERCSLEYLLDVWERCGGGYSLVVTDAAAGVPGSSRRMEQDSYG